MLILKLILVIIDDIPNNIIVKFPNLRNNVINKEEFSHMLKIKEGLCEKYN